MQLSRSNAAVGELYEPCSQVDVIEQCINDISTILVARGNSFQQAIKNTVYIMTDYLSKDRNLSEVVYHPRIERNLGEDCG
jgi:hypothetical protein